MTEQEKEKAINDERELQKLLAKRSTKVLKNFKQINREDLRIEDVIEVKEEMDALKSAAISSFDWEEQLTQQNDE